MRTSLIFLVSLVTIVTCHPLLFHLEKNGARAPDLLCPDATTQCPDGNTCCKLSNVTGYGCCPMPQAVCCEDSILCCPHTYSCSVSNTCEKVDSTVPMVKRLPSVAVARPTKSSFNVICPDYQTDCPEGNTCCKNADDSYGCCKLADAECCDDKLHCCPSGYTCNLSSDSCEKPGSVMPLFKKRPGRPVAWNGDGFEKQPATNSPQKVVCPGKKSECPSNSTCCLLKSGEYGCCPEPRAVCCKDKAHCCPEGYTCETDKGMCTKGDSIVPVLKKRPAIKKQPAIEHPQNIVCPDGKSECSSDSTCCILTSGQYGCCPKPNAVCCPDKEHCCPEDYACQGDGTCTDGDSVIAALKKKPATVRFVGKFPYINSAPQNKMCGDNKTQCADGNTCCELASKEFGCCPMANAVCCSDGVHCCPSGFTCDVANQVCSKGNIVLSLSKKMTAPIKLPPNVCPDQSKCSSDSTCCPFESGQYGCCPEPNAVCCQDKVHCCPKGYTCQTDEEMCTKGDSTIPMLKKQSAFNMPQNVVCPDGRSECPTNTTCCKSAPGQYSCCPFPNAVCCDDEKHCCPQYYACDESSGMCTKGDSIIPVVKKQPATLRHVPYNRPLTQDDRNLLALGKSSVVMCPDGDMCPDGSTCCKEASGWYGCCPENNAVCCADGKTCCPKSYICDLSARICVHEEVVLPLFERKSAELVRKKDESVGELLVELSPVVYEPQKYIPCGDNYFCQDSQKCCPGSDDPWECCPLRTGVCCDDKKHCCPANQTCMKDQCFPTISATRLQLVWSSKEAGKSAQTITEKKVPAMKSPQNIICPDQKSECSSNSTCCMLTSGQYGCCPMPEAVCCPDKNHCCPKGFNCQSGGTCTKEDSIIPVLKKLPAIKKTQNVKCQDNSECPEKSTCCKLDSGQYGCCPQENGVCCSDDVHCCPTGFTCDVADGTCTKGAAVTSMLQKQLQPIIGIPQNVICPNQQNECPDGNTCCPTGSSYACCPSSNAVCCPDEEHCCPQGYTCDALTQSCNSGGVVVPFLTSQLVPFLKTQRFLPHHRHQDKMEHDLL